MASSTRVRNSAAAEREHHRTNLWAQLARFIGLFLSPVLGLLTSWLIHLWVAGVSLRWGPIDWEIETSPAAVTVAVFLTTLVTIGIAYLAWQFAEHRKTVLRGALAGSVLVVGALFAINIGTGPHYWWSGLLLVGAGAVAVTWSIARLDVTRNDKQAEEKEEGFLEKVGLKGWRGKGKPVIDKNGDRVATEVEFEHAQGDTVDQLQEAVPAFESATGSPTGLSRAVGSDRADRSTLTVLHVDPLKDVLPLPDPSAPGCSIAEALLIGIYSTGGPVNLFIAGGDGFTPTSLIWMGMTRTGKTTAENGAMTEMISRRDVVILYLNKAKGMQDVRPLIPGVEAAVIADEQDESALYREAMRQVRNVLSYRQRQLALFGIDAWTPACFSSPPWRTDESGRRVQMEPMPFLFVHFGEADAILADDRRGESTYLASKGLSVGLATSWSLQRADHVMMPTGLRYNVGARFCFGCGDSDSVEFALPDNVIKAGAHPDHWRQNKPGYFYYVGPGIDDALFPVHARSFGTAPDGGKLSDELLRRNLTWGPRMAKLDSGSVAATDYDRDGKQGNWWRDTVAETDKLRATLLQGASADAARRPPANTPADDDDADAETDRETLAEMEEEMRNTTHVEGIELYPEDENGARATPQDATAPLTKIAEEDAVSWEPQRPAPRDREAAIDSLREALLHLFDHSRFQDPADPTGNTLVVTAAEVYDLYGFRSRPFFVEALIDMANGEIEVGNGLVLAAAPDLGATKGKYRLTRVPHGNAT